MRLPLSPLLRVLLAIAALVVVAAACSTTNTATANGADADSPGSSEASPSSNRSIVVEPDSLCAPAISVVRTWNDAILDAIRRDFPDPTVHARNLYHLAAANWDAWAAYDTAATGLFAPGKVGVEGLTEADVETARAISISYASYRLLTERYAEAVGSEASLAQFDETMTDLCLATDLGRTVPNSPAELGLDIAEAVISASDSDGANAASGYAPVNEPLVVAEPGTELVDPNRWQPLLLEVQITQNGLDVPSGLQEFVGQSWGQVTPFALTADPENGVPIDPGPPPLLGVDDAGYIAGAVEVIRLSSLLDPTQSDLIDISPAALGNAPLGTDDAVGHSVNPATGRPYEPNMTSVADYGRVIAEYWADGPDSETPPGHWNAMANEVSDQLAVDPGNLRIGGTGEPVNRLEWDVKLSLALNGATHDAAIAAWGAKEFYDYVRPISMIRYLGQRGELTEIPDLIETITEASSAPGQRHADLVDFVGEQAIWAWQGTPDDVERSIGGVGWIAASTWVPYQRPTFVTPSFSAYVSGHSTFSRAAAEVLAGFTGSEFFPGGISGHTVDVGELVHEGGPIDAVRLQWATYYDAADEAGRSRLYGGIHVAADDLAGRIIGAEAGRLAWNRAQILY